MKLPHLDCTTESRREEICQTHIVHADDCIVLFGGRTIKSDANNKTIKDKYYQFCCENKHNHQKYVIVCGSGAARHLCSLINEPLPRSMNPFIQEHTEHTEQEDNHNNETHWNPERRLLYYAIQLFIFRFQERLTPGTIIFDILHETEKEDKISFEPKPEDYKKFSTIVTKFNTNIPDIIDYLKQHGKLHNYNFSRLADKFHKLYPNEPNIFIKN